MPKKQLKKKSKNNKKKNVSNLLWLGVFVAMTFVGALSFTLLWGRQSKSFQSLKSTSINLKWVHQAQFTGMYVAQEKGFYKELGLDVDIVEGGIENPSIPTVLSGKADFAIAGADDLVAAVGSGEPLKAVAVIYRISPVTYISKSETNIKSPADFIGKRVGVRPGTGTDLPYYLMMDKMGLDRDAVNEVEVGVSFSDLENDVIDVFPGYRINEPRVIMDKGYDVNLINPEDWGVSIYADVLFTTDELIEREPQLVADVVEATMQGWQYAIENEDEAVDMIMKYAKHSTYEHQAYMLSKSLPLIHTGNSRLGKMEEQEWQKIGELLLSLDIIKEDIPVERIFTNQFIK